MRIAMMGSGGIGGYVGARLSEAGEEVIFIARGSHLDALRSKGLAIRSPLGDVMLEQVCATDTPSEIGNVDVVIFAVKTYDGERAAAAMAPLVGPDTTIITLQNGIDSVELLARHFPLMQVVGGATYISAFIEAPGIVVHAGPTKVLTGGSEKPVVSAFQASCNKRGIDAEMVEDIEPVIWEKFVALSAFSGATALLRSSIGPILVDPVTRRFIEQLRDEGAAVAAKANHPMSQGFEDRATSRWTVLPPDASSSMAKDLAAGKKIELSWLSGRMHTLGEALGVPTPGHSAVYSALHLYEAGTIPTAAQTAAQ